jgi:hypothetical protein
MKIALNQGVSKVAANLWITKTIKTPHTVPFYTELETEMRGLCA